MLLSTSCPPSRNQFEGIREIQRQLGHRARFHARTAFHIHITNTCPAHCPQISIFLGTRKVSTTNQQSAR
ncbi:hypothetical protein RB195_000772 [Necator americanus]|uniref:Uncharacterized protein n=1 Tax=Necator americanus TaxID=51031 RepID=A0ABR1DD00_NECAM